MSDQNSGEQLPAQTDSNVPAQLIDYGSYDIDTAKDESDQAARDAGGGTFYKWKAGPNILRVLPPPPGGTTPFKVRWRHWVDLPNGEAVKFNCPEKMAGQYCPVCEKAKKYKESADKGERDKGFNMSPNRRGLCSAIDRTNPDAGPIIVDMPGKKVYDPLLSMRQDKRGGGDFTDPVHGFDVIVKRSGGQKKNTDYEVLADRNNTQLADTVEVMNSWIMGQPDLSTYMRVPTPEEIRDSFNDALNTDEAAAAPASAPQLAPRAQAQAPAPQTRTAQDAVMDTSAAEPGEARPVTDDDIPF